MTKIVLKAEPRKVTGRKVRKLRREGYLPANIYGKKTKSQAVKVVLGEFEKIYQETGETSVVELLVEGKGSSKSSGKRPVLIHDIQKDPVSDQILHANFLQVDLKEKVKAQVPIELVGESPAEKNGLGTMVQQLGEVEVEALPTDLPEKFVVDISGLKEVNQGIQVSDLKSKSKVNILSGQDQLIVKIEPLRKEEEEVPAAAADEEEGAVPEGQEEEKTDEEKTEGPPASSGAGEEKPSGK